jgi:hypothetical protein
MTKSHCTVFRFASLLFLCFNLLVAGAQTPNHAWWNDPPPPQPKKNPKAKSLPLIHVYKNKFVNAKGDTILFRGLSISDPDKIERQGHWNKHHFEKVKELGTMLVRIPVHPIAWRERTPVKYFQLLDSAVEWCTDLGMYIIIDWHSIGNLKMELFQDPMYNTSQKETYEFWRTVAKHFSGNNTIAFYELFNEPTTYQGQLGNISWNDWKKMMEDIIHLIRAYDAETIELVAGFDWAYDLTPLCGKNPLMQKILATLLILTRSSDRSHGNPNGKKILDLLQTTTRSLLLKLDLMCEIMKRSVPTTMVTRLQNTLKAEA